MKTLKAFFNVMLLSLLCIGGVLNSAEAQSKVASLNNKFFNSSSPTKDTTQVYGTGVKTMEYSLKGYFSAVSVSGTIDRVGSNSIASGTFKLQKRLNSSAGWTDVSSATLTTANQATQSVTWDLPAGVYGDLRVHYTGGGSTGTSTARVWCGTAK